MSRNPGSSFITAGVPKEPLNWTSAQAENSTAKAIGVPGTVAGLLKDFSSYQPKLTIPLQGTYRGYDILSSNVPQSGIKPDTAAEHA